MFIYHIYEIILTSGFNFATCKLLTFREFRFCKAGACKMINSSIYDGYTEYVILKKYYELDRLGKI